MDSVELAEPGGLQIVGLWVRELHSTNPSRNLWVALDDRLRLALAQGWVFGVVGKVDNDLAEDLAADDSDNRQFDAMFNALIAHWRSVYASLQGSFGVVRRCILVGADLELVILTPSDYIGYRPAGEAFPAHSFITRIEGDEWTIAALARRLPIPGWPPSEEIVRGLETDFSR